MVNTPLPPGANKVNGVTKHSTGVLGLSVARSEIDKFVQKDSKQTITTFFTGHRLVIEVSYIIDLDGICLTHLFKSTAMQHVFLIYNYQRWFKFEKSYHRVSKKNCYIPGNSTL